MHTHELGLLAGSSEPCNYLIGLHFALFRKLLEVKYNLVKQALDQENLPMLRRELLYSLRKDFDSFAWL